MEHTCPWFAPFFHPRTIQCGRPWPQVDGRAEVAWLPLMSNTILIPPLNLGKYPEDHNINGDIMFDLKTRRFFDRDDANSTHAPFWWQDAEPFWSTAAKYGKKVTTDIFNLRRPRHIFFCSFRLQCSTGTHSSVEFLVYSSVLILEFQKCKSR